MLRSIFIFVLSLIVLPVSCQERSPKLVVGIVVDQMRQDYIDRFRDHFGEGGFNRFLMEGYVYENAHFNYIPTYTAPGHSAVYTGTTPAVNGIIGNSWFDQTLNETVYCAYDSTANTVGAYNENGKMSPHQLLVPTITDQLRESSQMKSKVVSVSIKDRGAIFPAGKLGEAYWYDSETGNFITSDYYHEELPSWVNAFNRRRLPDKYKQETWTMSLSPEEYTASDPDESPYEAGLMGRSTFPYELSKSPGYGAIPATPFGNDLLIEMAMAAMEGENLGMNEVTDMLALSFSSTDYVGHAFGPNSVEVQDMYIRLDRTLAALFDYLDQKIGKGEYLVFLSSDHGVAEVPKRMMDRGAGGGYLRVNVPGIVTEFIQKKFGDVNWVRNSSNMQVFLDRDQVEADGQNIRLVRNLVAEHLMQVEGIASVYTYDEMMDTAYDAPGVKGFLRRGFNKDRSGDILFVPERGWLQAGNDRGTSHGTSYEYDTHIPIMWYGKGISPGSTGEERHINDIAPTLARLLHIEIPESVTGNPLQEVLPE